MKHTADFPRLVTETRHPTPADIRGEIARAFADDAGRHPIGGVMPFIPSRALNLIDKAISDACRKYGEYQ